MKQNNFGWFIVVVCIVLWSFYEIYPPTPGDIIQEFSNRAQNKDAAFNDIVSRAQALEKTGTNTQYSALAQSVGTNNLQAYFPRISATNQPNPNQYILNRLEKNVAGRIKLGLDLQGGTSYLLEMNTDTLKGTNGQLRPEDVSGALSQAIEVLRKRVDKFGVAEPVIQAAGDNQIQVQLPGLSPADREAAIAALKKPAFLEFRLVSERSSDYVNPATGDILQPIPPGYEVFKRVQQKDGKMQVEAYLIKKRPASGEAPDYLAGNIINHASMGYDQSGGLAVDFQLSDDAAAKFGEITRNNPKRQLAIILDGELYSAPSINTPIETGNGQITGNFSRTEVQQLVDVLQNPLKASLNVVSTVDVGPTLGKDNITRGINASLYAVIFVSVFMLCYYFLAGLAANIALITNVIILLGVMCAAGTTFTLPGIAGGVLTVGMAVDANVLIYERIREELAKGKSLRGAIDAGYGRAFGTIFDSHVTTLISSVILIMLGTGEIQGFGVTLTIGVGASLFTALVVTRLIFNFLVDRNLISNLNMLHIIRSTSVNFMQFAMPLAVATFIFAIAAISYGGFARGHNLFGVDFVGGDSTTFTFVEKQPQDSLRSALDAAGVKDVQIQYQKDVAKNAETLQITSAAGSANNVESVLAQKFPQAQFKVSGGFSVGASVGRDIQSSAAISALVAMLGILFYVALRYEFWFAVAAIVAVAHDVLFAVGIYCISGRQFSATVVAAILTIIGFSINDKIVIFDRIREDLKLGMRGSFKEIINQALNQTLSRTIITSGTVFIATAVLFFYGGGAINDFAFTFLIGIVVGTYSSIFVASQVLLMAYKGERPAIGGSQVTVQNTAQAKV